jgi:hypothetical protein
VHTLYQAARYKSVTKKEKSGKTFAAFGLFIVA